ncbi:MAG: hypothetical protein IMX00_04325 [Limnochordales bacterium]|nr:hypothetical protein [Limnochordales bacterium]
MGNYLRRLKGSTSRDEFKFWHKQLATDLYAMDVDLALVSKVVPGIVAILDYKQPYDRVTFAEVLGYNHFLNVGIPVYLLRGHAPEFSELTVEEYMGGDWKPDPPRCETRVVLEKASPEEFLEWERKLRAAREGGQVA